MTIQIRKATIHDLPRVYSFELAYIREIEPAAEERWKDSIPLHLRQWISNIPRMSMAIQEMDPIGYCFWQVAGKAAVLASIFISPLWRRKGYGQILLKAFEQDAAENGFFLLRLGVHESNPASALYKSAGYHWTHKQDAYDYYEKEIL
ncbi:MAG: hypothetical protein A3K46_02330 [Chloroflexi bacterium RBG_13_60_9]|nr:MAG: hypothetical protein A3K46_02330 [Chloroflexi bacterium RBG_13_60_9]